MNIQLNLLGKMNSGCLWKSNIMNLYGDKYGSVFYSSRVLEQKDGLGFFDSVRHDFVLF
ncbi:MAG: hypothetical protein ACP5DZ_08665 [Bacteroidales bacterium]